MAVATLGQTIKFCAVNQTLMEITYKGSIRQIEVYSYRAAKNGNLLLYGYDVGAGKTKSFSVGEIEYVKATLQPFQPRWAIEI